MATGNFILDKGYDVSGAITKYRAVKYTAAEEVGPVTAATDKIAGFAQFSVATEEIARGKGASVRIDGITEAEVGDATDIAVGDWVEMKADGTVKKAVAASGNRVVGMCVGHPSTDIGDRISLRLDVNGPLVGAALP
jgi:predicted RecA/RadA family phage recombinase